MMKNLFYEKEGDLPSQIPARLNACTYVMDEEKHPQLTQAELAKRIHKNKIEKADTQDVGITRVHFESSESKKEDTSEEEQENFHDRKRVKHFKRIARTIKKIRKNKKYFSAKEIRLIMMCIKRQIPERPTEISFHDFFKCPHCRNVIEIEYVHFCSVCGQRLEWEIQSEETID